MVYDGKVGSYQVDQRQDLMNAVHMCLNKLMMSGVFKYFNKRKSSFIQ